MKTIYSFLVSALLSVFLVSATPTTGLQFSGIATSYIDLGQQAAFSPTQFTIEAWVNYQSFSGSYILSTEGSSAASGNNQGFVLRISDAKIQLSLGANADWPNLVGTTVLQLNTWYHVAATYSGTEIKLYVNGVLDASSTITTPMVASVQNLSIGEGSMWKGRSFVGKMADLRFWNVVRTSSEIADNMSTSLTVSETGLVANWKMDEGIGITVADATGNNTFTKPADVAWFIPSIESEITVIAPVKGLIFDGTKANSFVDFDVIPALASPSEFTIEALVNYNSITGAGYILSNEGWDGTNGSQGFSLCLNNNKIVFVTGTNSSWQEVSAPSSPILNTWYHVAVTYSSAAIKLYINGLEVASLSSPAAIGVSTQNLIMGEGSMWKSRQFDGKLGYVRMWSVAKTKQEIRDYTNTYATGSEVNLLASWNNDVKGETVADIKSTYAGTIGSDVTWFGFLSTNNIELNKKSKIELVLSGRTLEVTNKSNDLLHVFIYSITGTKVMDQSISAGSKLQKELLNSNGIYILSCITSDGLIQNKKFVISK